ncbi:hypothetical protein [Nocardioides jishulii]|uniref:ESX-1 secretion-associated protein n=1 Tax=Nocardioides jishulii TaxID=2575440 RepID=A0A4U2YUY5_9ACTN|nr:hypothetical protein [Nocardioides jishulii]QCX28555.1 hypothetical protein FCL41_14205 [Nocardioides jishulii]TKI64552.1 hypothetical protein FC770_05370 [Nocardioides jishulii]
MREPVAPRLRIDPDVLEAEANRLRVVADAVNARGHFVGGVAIGQDSFGLLNVSLASAVDLLRDRVVDALRDQAEAVAVTADAVTALSRDMGAVDAHLAALLAGRCEW